MVVSDLIETTLQPGLVNQVEQDAFWMRQALILADYAEQEGEVPVGAVVVKEGILIGYGYNKSITLNDPTAHAEMLALRMAGHELGNYRLPGTCLYVTLEPCAMCATAMVHARVERLVFGAKDAKTGASGSVLNLAAFDRFNHQIVCESGVLSEPCANKLSQFFQKRREQKRLSKKSTG